MGKNLNSHTGYLIIDHSNSPGINPNDIPDKLRNSTLAVKEGQKFEADTKICSHCERGIILNPGRVRDRAICFYCHHYICDECDRIMKISGKCVPMKKIVDEMQSHNVHHPDEPLIVIPSSF